MGFSLWLVMGKEQKRKRPTDQTQMRPEGEPDGGDRDVRKLWPSGHVILTQNTCECSCAGVVGGLGCRPVGCVVPKIGFRALGSLAGTRLGRLDTSPRRRKRQMQTARRPAGVTPIGQWAGWTSGLPRLLPVARDCDVFLADIQLAGEPLRPATLGCCPISPRRCPYSDKMSGCVIVRIETPSDLR